MNINYRRAIPSDNSDINNLFIEMIDTINKRMIENGEKPISGCENGYKEGYLDTFYINDNRTIFVADNGEKVVGYLSVVIHDNYLYLDDYSVSKQFRGYGIGSKLIKISEEFANEKCLDIIKLHVQNGNHQSIDFYLRRGYNLINKDEKGMLLGKKIK